MMYNGENYNLLQVLYAYRVLVFDKLTIWELSCIFLLVFIICYSFIYCMYDKIKLGEGGYSQWLEHYLCELSEQSRSEEMISNRFIHEFNKLCEMLEIFY